LIVNNYYQIVKIETFIKNNRLNNVLVQKMESEITLSHKYQGMIVGAAIGDALGMPVENLSHQEIKERYGFIQYYLKPDRRSKLSFLKPGQYTDDTQLMIATIRGLTKYQHHGLDSLVTELLSSKPSLRGAGQATWTALNRLQEVGPKESGVEKAEGAGAMTRVAPLAVLAYKKSDLGYELLVEDATSITHKSDIAKASVFLYGRILTNLLNSFIDLKSENSLKNFADAYSKESTKDSSSVVLLKQKIRNLPSALTMTDENFVEKFGTSGSVSDVLPAALYCFLKSPLNFEESIFRSVNLGGDADTIAFVTGQLSGTYNGIENIPHYLINKLENNQQLKQYSLDLYREVHS